MSIKPHWRTHQYGTGWYPIPADDTRSVCLYCKEALKKKHGLNRNREGAPSVMALFLFGVGPYCINCGLKAWCDHEFFNRQGSDEYYAGRHDLMSDFRPKGITLSPEEEWKLTR